VRVSVEPPRAGQSAKETCDNGSSGRRVLSPGRRNGRFVADVSCRTMQMLWNEPRRSLRRWESPVLSAAVIWSFSLPWARRTLTIPGRGQTRGVVGAQSKPTSRWTSRAVGYGVPNPFNHRTPVDLRRLYR
jgi:hypothetical protein